MFDRGVEVHLMDGEVHFLEDLRDIPTKRIQDWRKVICIDHAG